MSKYKQNSEENAHQCGSNGTHIVYWQPKLNFWDFDVPAAADMHKIYKIFLHQKKHHMSKYKQKSEEIAHQCALQTKTISDVADKQNSTFGVLVSETSI